MYTILHTTLIQHKNGGISFEKETLKCGPVGDKKVKISDWWNIDNKKLNVLSQKDAQFLCHLVVNTSRKENFKEKDGEGKIIKFRLEL